MLIQHPAILFSALCYVAMRREGLGEPVLVRTEPLGPISDRSWPIRCEVTKNHRSAMPRPRTARSPQPTVRVEPVPVLGYPPEFSHE